MIKILLVDDEAFIRQGIRHTIPWEEHGMEIVGEAANGEDGLKLAIQLAPDIVFTDIQMPVMNGIELARKLNEYLPRTKVIILSAYGNTENFTSAIEVKVSSFVLKNADSGKILESALRVKESILAEYEAQGQNALIQTIYNENQQLIKSDLFAKFLKGEVPLDKFRKRAEKLDIPLPGPFYSLLVASCQTNDNWIVHNLFIRAFEEFQPFVFFIDRTRLVAVLNVGPDGLTDDRMDKAFPGLKPHIFGNSLVVMNRIDALEHFADCYAMLDKALDGCFWHSEREYTKVSTHDTFSSSEPGQAQFCESKVISAVLSKNPAQMEQALLNYFTFMQENSVSRSRFLESVNRIAVLMEAVMDRQSESHKTIDIIAETETPEEIIELVLSLAKPVKEGESKNVHFAAALDYISRNYNEDLKLADVAKAAYLSTGYLSRIFKNETGYSFKEWLNRIRINKAKELILNSDLKYYEIAELVGYKDYKYFSAYFSKLCGISAKEYKMQKLTQLHKSGD
ncbi:response regulator [Paenibacillus sp. NPDC058174]|uniref:response regulator n=1 Tax=Paenibacillus sp. NPDC058174 TaxID=3346366 RepID=UPI0036DA4D8F